MKTIAENRNHIIHLSFIWMEVQFTPKFFCIDWSNPRRRDQILPQAVYEGGEIRTGGLSWRTCKRKLVTDILCWHNITRKRKHNLWKLNWTRNIYVMYKVLLQGRLAWSSNHANTAGVYSMGRQLTASTDYQTERPEKDSWHGGAHLHIFCSSGGSGTDQRANGRCHRSRIDKY